MTERGAQPGDVEYQQQASEAEMLLQAEEQGLRRRQLSPRQKSELIDKLGLAKYIQLSWRRWGISCPNRLALGDRRR
jgi:hypothetical protein